MIIVTFALFLLCAILCTINCWTATKYVQQGKDASFAVAAAMFTFIVCFFLLGSIVAPNLR